MRPSAAPSAYVLLGSVTQLMVLVGSDLGISRSALTIHRIFRHEFRHDEILMKCRGPGGW
jgi:hypothetical protein